MCYLEMQTFGVLLLFPACLRFGTADAAKPLLNCVVSQIPVQYSTPGGEVSGVWVFVYFWDLDKCYRRIEILSTVSAVRHVSCGGAHCCILVPRRWYSSAALL